MNRNQEWLVGGILCLIISIGFSVMNKRITTGTIVAFILFLFGIYKAFGPK